MSDNGVVFNIQRYSIDDGPGIRTTVFLKGCPLKCLWCSNPESQSYKPEVGHRQADCIQCGSCIDACENHAISVKDGHVVIDKTLCVNCGKCTEACITGALCFLGKEMTTDEVFNIVQKDTIYYKHSSGGITVSGGEPLTQADFTRSLLKKCCEQGIHTCIETCGTATAEQFEKVLPYTSLVLFDLKHINDETHQKLTCGSNKPIFENLKLVLEKQIPLVLRMPLIPTLNDSEEDINQMARQLKALTESATINIMPYHNFGEHKYQMLFRPYELSHIQRPSKEKLDQIKHIFESMGHECEIH